MDTHARVSKCMDIHARIGCRFRMGRRLRMQCLEKIMRCSLQAWMLCMLRLDRKSREKVACFEWVASFEWFAGFECNEEESDKFRKIQKYSAKFSKIPVNIWKIPKIIY